MSYRLSDEARQQLEEILTYVAERNLPAATRLSDDFIAAFLRLGDLPQIGHHVTGLADPPFKLWTLPPYVIVYDTSRTPIVIVAVHHGARNLI